MMKKTSFFLVLAILLIFTSCQSPKVVGDQVPYAAKDLNQLALDWQAYQKGEPVSVPEFEWSQVYEYDTIFYPTIKSERYPLRSIAIYNSDKIFYQFTDLEGTGSSDAFYIMISHKENSFADAISNDHLPPYEEYPIGDGRVAYCGTHTVLFDYKGYTIRVNFYGDTKLDPAVWIDLIEIQEIDLASYVVESQETQSE